LNRYEIHYGLPIYFLDVAIAYFESQKSNIWSLLNKSLKISLLKGKYMKLLCSAIVIAILLLLCSDACAQFRGPPRTSPPTCDRQKDGGDEGILKSDCKVSRAMPNVSVSLYCYILGFGTVQCIAETQAYNGVQWEILDPSTLTHHWDFIVDDREYSLDPNNDFHLLINCGYGMQGYARVTIGEVVAQTGFACAVGVDND
jgi:hypothetical protein